MIKNKIVDNNFIRTAKSRIRFEPPDLAFFQHTTVRSKLAQV